MTGYFAAADLPEKMSARALMANSTEATAIINTGSTYHILTDASFFVRTRACEVRLKLIAVCAIHLLAKGTAHVKIGNAGILLEDVSLTSWSVNLLSVPALVRRWALRLFWERFPYRVSKRDVDGYDL